MQYFKQYYTNEELGKMGKKGQINLLYRLAVDIANDNGNPSRFKTSFFDLKNGEYWSKVKEGDWRFDAMLRLAKEAKEDILAGRYTQQVKDFLRLDKGAKQTEIQEEARLEHNFSDSIEPRISQQEMWAHNFVEEIVGFAFGVNKKEVSPHINRKIIERAEKIYSDSFGSTKKDFDEAYIKAIKEIGRAHV